MDTLLWRMSPLVAAAADVRLADDRRFVGAVLFLFFFFVVLVVIRISGRHRVANAYEGAPVNQPGGQFSGLYAVMLLLPRTSSDDGGGTARPGGNVAASARAAPGPGESVTGTHGLNV